jgi:CRP/FNR family transcriptional regulator, cyclic AMP receptor protein
VEHAEDVLSRAPLFEALDDEGAKALRSLVTDVDLVRAERLFDEGDSLFDPRPRTSSAVAVTDTRLAALAHDELLDWLTGRPEVSLHLLRALAQRLRRANDVMADLVFTDVPGRVAKALLDLADRFGEQTPEGLQVHHDLTQEELAQLVGASRETVNKALADFAARGWLTLSAKSVLIIDADRLAKRAH